MKELLTKIALFAITISMIVVGCNENAEPPEYKPNGLLSDPLTQKIVTESKDWGKEMYYPNGDTFQLKVRYEERTFTYSFPVIDTVVKPFVKQTDPGPVDPPPTTGYSLLSFIGYNNASEINTGQGMYNKYIDSLKTEGSGSFRTEVRGNQASQSSGYRSEMQYNDAKQNPVEGAVEYDVYYENWKPVNGGGHSIQWHPNSSSGSAVLSLQNYGGKFNVVRSLNDVNYHQPGTLMTTQPNRWYKMRWEIKWSTGSDGYIRLYIDNNLYYSFTGKTTNGGTYIKIGQNRWNMSSGQNTIVYYDNVRFYKKA